MQMLESIEVAMPEAREQEAWEPQPEIKDCLLYTSVSNANHCFARRIADEPGFPRIVQILGKDKGKIKLLSIAGHVPTIDGTSLARCTPNLLSSLPRRCLYR